MLIIMNADSPSKRFPGRTTQSLDRPVIAASFERAYGAQLAWRHLPLKERLAKLGAIRGLLVSERFEIADAFAPPNRDGYRETLTAEILPLADSLRWLVRRGRAVLKPRYTSSRHTPIWLGRLRSTVHRVPYGLVLILGASNYPLLLTGVQLTQALAAGNAVAIKPAPGTERVTRKLVQLAIKAGIPEELIVVLDSSVEAATQAIDAGVDKVVLTGSSRTGRVVLKQLSDSLTPATLELSGCDAVYVLPGADMHRVCEVVLFGQKLNGSATCIAPRRIFVPRKSSEVFHRLLSDRLQMEQHSQWSTRLPASVYKRLWDGVREAESQGAKIFESDRRGRLSPLQELPSDEPPESRWASMGHLFLTDATPQMSLCSADIFAPVSLIVPVDDWTDALEADSYSPYALGASIYGPLEDALRLSQYISAGSVTINDTIVPTADPQLPFGGRGESGFGTTRGDEGLLEMTVPKVVSIRKGSWLPHTDAPSKADEHLIDGILQLSHADSWRGKWVGFQQLIRAAIAKRNTT